jgi:hypothetical protein
MAETLSTRGARLEELAKVLLDAQIKTEERFRQTDERFRQTDARIEKLGADLDARIEKLVIAIGELIDRMDGRQK